MQTCIRRTFHFACVRVHEQNEPHHIHTQPGNCLGSTSIKYMEMCVRARVPVCTCDMRSSPHRIPPVSHTRAALARTYRAHPPPHIVNATSKPDVTIYDSNTATHSHSRTHLIMGNHMLTCTGKRY